MIEFVWDEERRGTGTTASGASLDVGDAAEWSPVDLLALAAAGCVMRTFLQVAAEEHVPVLGYLSTSVGASDEAPSILVVPCIVVPTVIAEVAVLVLMQQAVERSPVARLLADRLTVKPDVHQVASTAGAGE